MRDPRTPDCGIDGCERATSRMGVCREHSYLVPLDASRALQAAAMTASMTLRREHHAAAVKAANERLRAERAEA